MENKLSLSVRSTLQKDYTGSMCKVQSILILFSSFSFFSRSETASGAHWIRDSMAPFLKHLILTPAGTLRHFLLLL
jgi:hypothetical protein